MYGGGYPPPSGQGYPMVQQAVQNQGYPPTGYGAAPGYGVPASGGFNVMGSAPGYGGAPAPAPGTVYSSQTTTVIRTQTSGTGAVMAPPPSTFQNSWFSSYFNSIQQQEMIEIQTWFRSVDRDGSGQINANEIAGITFNNVPLGIEVATKLVRIFDKNGSGTIDFYEYAALHKFLASLQTAFFAGDRDRSGRLDAREIHIALNSCGFNASLPAVTGLTTRYNRGYGLGFQEFLLVCSTIAQARSLFDWKDPQRTGRITITLDQLLELVGQMG